MVSSCRTALLEMFTAQWQDSQKRQSPLSCPWLAIQADALLKEVEQGLLKWSTLAFNIPSSLSILLGLHLTSPCCNTPGLRGSPRSCPCVLSNCPSCLHHMMDPHTFLYKDKSIRSKPHEMDPKTFLITTNSTVPSFQVQQKSLTVPVPRLDLQGNLRGWAPPCLSPLASDLDW